MNPDDFMKNLDERATDNQIKRDFYHTCKILKKHFIEWVPYNVMREILDDEAIPIEARLGALQERAQHPTLTQLSVWGGRPVDIITIMKKGLKSALVQKYIKGEYSCYIFPMKGLKEYVIHTFGTKQLKTTKLKIEGDGLAIVIQSLESFVKEYK